MPIFRIKISDPLNAYLQNTISNLLSFDKKKYIGSLLPEWLTQIDPNGYVVPQLILQKLEHEEDDLNLEQICGWLRYASHYFQKEIWRPFAIWACRYAEHKQLSGDELSKIYVSITHSPLPKRRAMSIEGYIGMKKRVVEDAKNSLNSETEDILRGYWEWKYEAAKINYDETLKRHQEI